MSADTAPDADIVPWLRRLADGHRLDADEAMGVFDLVLDGAVTPAQLGALLMALRIRGESAAELDGAVRALRSRMVPVRAPAGAIDTCGTGGDGGHTLNISTAVALVVAACGVPVAKHGNRAVSSRSGAADVLEALGVGLDHDVAVAERALREINVAFLFATRHHAAMRHAAQCRRELGTRTIMNLLGPLANPAGVTRQLIGVYSPLPMETMARVLRALGSERVWLVHGEDGVDELSISGATDVVDLRGDGEIVRDIVTPEDAGLERFPPGSLRGGDAKHNADALRRLLEGERGAYREAVLLNAAAALLVAGRTDTLRDGAGLARHALDSRGAADTLDALVRITGKVDA